MCLPQAGPKEKIRRFVHRGVAQLASASGLGPEGPVFESQYHDRIQRATWFHAALFRIPAFSPSKISYCRRDCINFADYRDY